MNRNKIISIIAVCFIIIGIAVAVVGGVGGSSKNELTDDNMDDTVIVDVDADKEEEDVGDDDSSGNENLFSVEITIDDLDKWLSGMDDMTGTSGEDDDQILLVMDPSFRIPEDEITTYYEKDPEYVKGLEADYGKDNLIYVEGRSYAMYDKDGDGYCDGSCSMCPEGDERLSNTLLRSDYEFLEDFFCSINKAVMTKDEDGNATVELIISSDKNWESYVGAEVYFYDEEDVLIAEKIVSMSDMHEDTKYRMLFKCESADGIEASYFKINNMTFIGSYGAYGWNFW